MFLYIGACIHIYIYIYTYRDIHMLMGQVAFYAYGTQDNTVALSEGHKDSRR